MKSPVKLRKKKLTNGNESLYLDIYMNGKRKYEYLQLYLIPAKTANDRELNKRTLLAAEQIRSQRMIDMMENKNQFFQKTAEIKSEITISEFIQQYNKHNNAGKNIMSRIKKFGLDRRLTDLEDNSVMEEFRQNLLVGLKQNTRCWYNDSLKSIIYTAKLKRFLPESVVVQNEKKIETERNFLTFEEIKKLINTPCRIETLKNAFLFSCFSGLRISDVIKLRWKDLSEIDGYTRITFQQQKTNQLEYLDISKQATSFINRQPQTDEFIFPIKYHEASRHLPEWIARAGIDKNITFHCARHSFAIMMVDLGTDLYVVSKLLGHRDVKTTQIYAKVLDKTKRAAVDKIPEI